MRAQRVEVGVERFEVHGHVGRGLRAVDHDDRTDRMCAWNNGIERRDGAERVADLRKRDELAAVQQRVEIIEHVHAAVVDGNEAQLRPGFLGEHLPRYEVRVVLELRYENRIAAAHVLQTPRMCDQIDRLGGVAGPNDLLRLRIEEGSHRFAGLFKRGGRALGDFIDAAMNVGIVLRVVLDQRIDHDLRLLRGGGRIEVDQPFAARRGPLQDGEVGNNAAHFGIGGRQAHAILASNAARNRSRRAVVGKRSMTGSKKPSAIIFSEASRVMPRLSI